MKKIAASIVFVGCLAAYCYLKTQGQEISGWLIFAAVMAVLTAL